MAHSQPATDESTVNAVSSAPNRLATPIKESQMSSTSPKPSVAGFDLDALRLPANYGDTLGVRKVLTKVHVGRFPRDAFFRVRPGADWKLPVMILDRKAENEIYVVLPAAYGALDAGLVKRVELNFAVDRNNNPALIPIPLPGEDGKWNSYHQSLAQAALRAESKWLRITANMSASGYDVFEAIANLSEPEWPECSMSDLVEIAFRGKIIAGPDHPIVDLLQGRV